LAASAGGLANAGSATATLTNTTVTANQDNTGAGGGLSVATPGGVNLRNSIVAGNSWGGAASDIGGVVNGASAFNLIGTGGGGGLADGANNNLVGVSDPRLGPLADNGGPTQTHALLPGSPALNAGDYLQYTNPDQRGNVRGRVVSIGAYDPNATRLVFSSVPPTVAAGGDLTFTLTALDAFGRTAVGYLGGIGVYSDDPRAPFLGGHQFTVADAGSFTFNGQTLIQTLLTTGSWTLSAVDSYSTLRANAAITVTPAEAARLDFTSPTTVRAGDPFSVTVTAYDEYGNLVTDYAGTVRVTSDDPRVPVLGSHTFVAADQGSFTFTGLVLETAGVSYVTVSDGGLSSETRVTVNPGDFAQLLLQVPNGAVTLAGVPLYTYLTAADAFGNAVPSYRGHVTVTSSDPQRPNQYSHTFVAADQGSVVFTAVLFTAGDQTLTASDGVVSQTIVITVQHAALQGFALGVPTTVTAGAPFAVTVTAEDLFGNAVTVYTGTVRVSW
jgi:hypothetical protein